MGTDSGVMPTSLAGFDEHRELQRLAEAGLTPKEATVRVTPHSGSGRGMIGEPCSRGDADFILLSANPLDDIHAARIMA